VSHRLSRRLNNATGQCPIVRPSHVDNDGTVARDVSTSRCPVVCPVIPLLFRPTTRGWLAQHSQLARPNYALLTSHLFNDKSATHLAATAAAAATTTLRR